MTLSISRWAARRRAAGESGAKRSRRRWFRAAARDGKLQPGEAAEIAPGGGGGGGDGGSAIAAAAVIVAGGVGGVSIGTLGGGLLVRRVVVPASDDIFLAVFTNSTFQI